MLSLALSASCLLANIIHAQESENSTSLNLNTPQLEAAPSDGLKLGPIHNLNFGGALDFRFYFPRIGGATEEHLGFGSFDIHVAELFLTTNVGNNISILAEQLLVTSKMGDTVGQDHGFVYAIFSNLPMLPDNVSLKVGRTRFRFGLDARLDSPANVLKSSVYKSLGTITDKGIEVSGYAGPIEWSLGIMNGVDTIEKSVTTRDGSLATIEVPVRNGSKPLVARLSAEITDQFNIAISGFSGKSYPVVAHDGFAMHDMIFNGHTESDRLIYKNRAAIDAKLKIGSRLDLSTEYTFGQDFDQGKRHKVWTAFGRLDYRLRPSKLSLQLQYEYFNDGRTVDDNMPYGDTGNLGLALNYYLTEQSWIRAAWLQDDRGLFRSKTSNPHAPEYMGIIQTLVTF